MAFPSPRHLLHYRHLLHRLLCRIGDYLYPNRFFAVTACRYRALLLSGARESVAPKSEPSVRLVAARIDVRLLHDARRLNDYVARRDGETDTGTHRSQLLFHRDEQLGYALLSAHQAVARAVFTGTKRASTCRCQFL